jgi:putative membrane protein
MVNEYLLLKNLINALLFSFVGLVVLAISFVIYDKVTPGNLWKEIFQEKNLAVAITVAAMVIGISQIIAAAIHG